MAIRTSASTAPVTATLATRRDGETLVVQLAGQWRLRAGLPSTAPVEQALATTPPPRSIAFDTTGLTSWDSSGLAVLDRIATVSKARQIAIQPEGLPEGLQRLLALATAVPEKSDAHVASPPPWLARVGSAAQGAWEGTLSAIQFLGEATLSFGRFLRGTAIFQWRDILLVLQESGPNALGIVTLINFLVGLIIAFVGAVQLQKFGASIYVADLVAIATVRELAPIMTGIIMAGRTGSGFAAELGTMQVNQEIEAFSTMAVPPMDFLVLPRMLALSFMMPLLCLYADLIGMLGGAVVGIGMLGQGPRLYWEETTGAIGLLDISIGVGKGLLFGILVALAGCLRGMTCGRDAAAVGQAATSAVVLGIVWIIALDGVLAVVTNVLGI
ncbi:MAG TPA: ABC transporter permease [Candidatus Binatia bacterium]|nr:ABC transporter permease [Candidatus Binatia bacterium]